MTIDTKHPLYSEQSADWQKLRDGYKGDRAYKERGFEYLPATASMIEDGAHNRNEPGWSIYCAYRKRARYPGVVRDAVEAMLGVMHNKPATIKLPEKLEYLRERATSKNETLQGLIMRINQEQMLMGRIGLLLDVDSVGVPYLATYDAEDCINWAPQADRDWPELVVIDESGNERIQGDPFKWEATNKYRVLTVQGGIAVVAVASKDTEAELVWVPIAVKGTTLDRVPFVFINSKDIATDPDESPLLDLACLAETIYRGEADYRQALFMQGQDTLVIIGGRTDKSDAVRIGAQGRIEVNPGGDAKYIGVSSTGLPEMRQSLAADYAQANQRATALLEATSRSAESGEALRVRVAARTASLNQVAMTGGFGLQEILRLAAILVKADPAEVIVEPNLDFVADKMPGSEVRDIAQARAMGAPLSEESFHEVLQERGLTSKSYEEEKALMEKEAAAAPDGAGSRMVDAIEEEEQPVGVAE